MDIINWTIKHFRAIFKKTLGCLDKIWLPQLMTKIFQLLNVVIEGDQKFSIA
jgi:hypothetical protein